MMTFKDLKKLVELPSYKEQRVPTVKALEVSGVPVVTEKVLENHGSIQNIPFKCPHKLILLFLIFSIITIEKSQMHSSEFGGYTSSSRVF